MGRPRTRARDLFGQLLSQRRGHEEDAIQIAIVSYVRWAAPQCLITHFANGGWRSKAEAGKFKAMGVIAGMPDLILFMPEQRIALWEVKTETTDQSREQLWTAGELLALGHDVAVVRSVDDAKAELEALGIPTREARS